MHEIGIDCVDTTKFKNSSDTFLERVFTKKEFEYCNKFANNAEHLAARFAAKEAIKKALGGFQKNLDFKDIEVKNLDNGKPTADLLDESLNDKFNIKISMSHSKDLAIAIAMISRKE